MKMVAFVIILLTAVSIGLCAPPYMVTATNYASGFFGVVADENGQPLSIGSVVHLIWDSEGDGMDEPSENGMPTDDDVLIGSCQVGITGGAPSTGTFVLPGSAPNGGGLCYLRAFHAANPVPGTFYSNSMTQYNIPDMDDPIIYGVQFPDFMTLRLGETQALTVSVIPDDPPVILPANGGSFSFQIGIENNIQNPVGYDLWFDLVLPNGSVYGPLLSRTGLTMPVGGSISRQLSQSIPPGAPAGIYMYMVHTGDNRIGTIIHQDGFPFEKSGAGGSDNLSPDMIGWELTGWEEGAITTVTIPEIYFLDPPFPNPFNPTTQLQFGLPEASHVQIDVYNILGSRVTTLIDKKLTAGYHNIVWDAPTIASGLYLVQMKAGGFVHTKKAFLLK